MGKAGKPFTVDTRPTKEVVVDSLTRDATVEACIFDLIDNSIDAARETIFAGLSAEARKELPDDFTGFDIKLHFSGAGFKIEDNCGGITVAKLKTMVLKFGERSAHELGIGIFGVGLNRALFKLGKVSHLKTDTGGQRAELVLNVEEYLASNDWELPAEEFSSTGSVGTEIEIRQLQQDIAKQFADADWIKNTRHEIGRRYGRFIAKKLKISVNREHAKGEEVRLREDGPYEGEYKFYKTEGGVSIHVRHGQHSEHRFTNERGYSQERNSELTDQYGWTILCNDRAVIMSDKTWKTGWDTKFHSEFYGFAGFVNFVAADPAKLPWKTTKTDVDLNNPAYQMALEDMRRFAQKWRSFADQRKKKSGHPLRPVPPKPKQSEPKPTGKPTKTTKQVIIKPIAKDDHNQFRTVLPQDVDEKHCFDKHLALVHDAKQLDLAVLTYSGLALIRMLFESTVVNYLERHGRYAELVKFAVDTRKKKIPLSADDEKKLIPKLEEMLTFLINNPALWGAAKANHLKHSMTKMSGHKQTLNSALHNPFQQINRSVAFQIRDEVLPMLRHMIEK